MTIASELIVDEVLEFHVVGWAYPDGRCQIRVYVRHGVVTPTVVLTELPDNAGPSITNAIEHIMPVVRAHPLVDSSHGLVVIEHYGWATGPSLSLVTFDSVGAPRWRALTVEQAAVFVGGANLDETPEMSA